IRKGAGRKSTGRERDKTISFKVTEDEREYIYKVLDKIGGKRTESILKLLKKYEKE
ncbi:MAG: hypothetical protein HXM47_10535, partial [Pseudoleptotrichia goodfellowii]|nr:hypothetical protein [Pseudoleptotrichia goodfellowii]